jgi:putative transposase
MSCSTVDDCGFLPWSTPGAGFVPCCESADRRQRWRLPATIRVDQGSQFTSKELDLWAYSNGVTLDFSRPGKPTDNAYVESFNATVRLECLGRHWFLDLDDAREKVEEWRTEYNEVRPHSAIGDRTPKSLIDRLQHDVEVANRPEILI